ncbi:DDE_Tnp_1_7 domain-containing protein [Trichonephila inaurata madagascariensis]|uniref:DDE_Tnp_1_7 domain-containing protein n=1 Tax=Trichonephila inaurata madagascariensis TaxID=2747483 RepID=A0A8X6MJ64_9ARAC|nr:DDE_Tnp_1_7 domain-containing protein [Trichonephila inaurata madagascariensis]
MTHNLPDKNPIIIIDNYFSSISLFEYLKRKSIYAIGRVRDNRSGLSKVIDDKKMKRGDFDNQISNQGIYFFKWKDNRPVYFLCNCHGDDTCVVERKLTQRWY